MKLKKKCGLHKPIIDLPKFKDSFPFFLKIIFSNGEVYTMKADF